MKLLSFSVTNFRSITTAHKINLHEKTVLVGKNNEGKSNLLTALNIAMSAVIMHGNKQRIPIMRYRKKPYSWKRDFPIQLQNRKRGHESIFRLDFRLNEKEVQELHDLTGIRGNEDIPISIRIGKDDEAKIDVPKKGSSAYNKKSSQITEFISKRITVNYIQAIRTEDMAIDALQTAILSELRSLNSNNEYVEALNKIDILEQEVLDGIADQLQEPLKPFLPSLKSVSLIKESDQYQRTFFRNNIDVILDDGIATSISDKGDGIKSLVTLAILKDRRSVEGASVIAIEEPESHLHPGAIHDLVDVINRMSENNQVIITTHNPLFVQQNRISSNVIVDKGTAKEARSIAEIRNVLGVLPSDNLINARYVIVVEGEDDRIILEKILPSYSSRVSKALKNNTIVIKPIGGAGNLSHELYTLRNNMCKFVVLMDNDKAGIEAVEKAVNHGLLKESDCRFAICNGSSESEMEDCINTDIYKDILKDEYRININVKQFRSSKKWSERMKNTCLEQGIKYTENLERKIKMSVAMSIPSSFESINDIIIPQKGGFLKGLTDVLEDIIGQDEDGE